MENQYDELYNEFQAISKENNLLTEDNKYLSDFITFKGLQSEFEVFKKCAIPDPTYAGPFPPLIIPE